MAQGFVPDHFSGGLLVSGWHAGPPEKSFWTKTRAPSEEIPIGAFRCQRCGFLEFYADARFAAH